MELLFEVRFAFELHQAGRTAKYEFKTGVGGSTVDFRVDGTPPWLVEVVSLRISDPVRNATREDGDWTEVLLSTNAADEKQSEEAELIRVQTRIGGKVFCRKKQRPHKFPTPEESKALHMIVVDARGLFGSDTDDYDEIAYGHPALNPEERWKAHYWQGKPILGLFDPKNSQWAAELIQKRIHLLAFVCEKDYREGEIGERVYYCCNPHLLSDPQYQQRVRAELPLGCK